MSFDRCLTCGGPASVPHGQVQCIYFLKSEVDRLKRWLRVSSLKYERARDERNALMMKPNEPCKGCSFSNYGEACQYKKVCVPRQQYYQYWAGIDPEE